MYFDFFGLKKNPFRITPDEDFIYLMGGHKNSYAYLKYTALSNDGFMLLSGEIGTGKTILLKKLQKDLSPNIKIINISQTQLKLDDLLRVFLYELTSSFEGKSRAELIIRIRENLLLRKDSGDKTLLIIDEAQNLDRECLEEIRLLADEILDGENLINVILAGQPEIEKNIETYGLEQLKQRIRITYRLSELNQRDVMSYIDFRAYVGFGNNPFYKTNMHFISSQISQRVKIKYKRLFSSDVSDVVYKSTRGVPRLINTLCETSLVLAFGDSTKQVDVRIVNQAIDELGWLVVEEDSNSELQLQDTSNALFSIEVSQDGKNIKSIHVDHLPFTIGRGEMNDLVLINKTVSKQHAVLEYRNDKLIIQDCNSTNGVKINGLKVVAHVISNGEIVQVGRYKLKILMNIKQSDESEGDTVEAVQIEQIH